MNRPVRRVRSAEKLPPLPQKVSKRVSMGSSSKDLSLRGPDVIERITTQLLIKRKPVGQYKSKGIPESLKVVKEEEKPVKKGGKSVGGKKSKTGKSEAADNSKSSKKNVAVKFDLDLAFVSTPLPRRNWSEPQRLPFLMRNLDRTYIVEKFTKPKTKLDLVLGKTITPPIPLLPLMTPESHNLYLWKTVLQQPTDTSLISWVPTFYKSIPHRLDWTKEGEDAWYEDKGVEWPPVYDFSHLIAASKPKKRKLGDATKLENKKLKEELRLSQLSSQMSSQLESNLDSSSQLGE